MEVHLIGISWACCLHRARLLRNEIDQCDIDESTCHSSADLAATLDALSRSTTVRELTVDLSPRLDVMTRGLSSCLAVNSTLVKLDVSCTHVAVPALKVLVQEGLLKNASLQSLELRDAKMSDPELALLLCRFARQSKSLVSLKLPSLVLSGEGLCELLFSIEQHPSLKEFELVKLDAGHVESYLEDRIVLEVIAKAMAAVIPNLSKLMHLCVSFCYERPDVAYDTFEEALNLNWSLIEFRWSSTMGRTIHSQLPEIKKRNKLLASINDGFRPCRWPNIIQAALRDEDLGDWGSRIVFELLSQRYEVTTSALRQQRKRRRPQYFKPD